MPVLREAFWTCARRGFAECEAGKLARPAEHLSAAHPFAATFEACEVSKRPPGQLRVSVTVSQDRTALSAGAPSVAAHGGDVVVSSSATAPAVYHPNRVFFVSGRPVT